MNRFDLPRPSRLDQALWAALDSYRARLERSASTDDYASTIGAAKDLVESVARVVLVATGEAVADNAKFPRVVETAQSMLSQRPAALDGHPSLRAIVSSAQKLVLSANEIRNDVGVGHGRAEIIDIPEATVTAVTDACLLWCRWVLTILEPVLDRDVNVVIELLRTSPTMAVLKPAFRDFALPSQLPPHQRALGVAFGQSAGGGFGNALRTGFPEPEDEMDLERWPANYRLGFAEGLLISQQGHLRVGTRISEWLVQVLRPLTDGLSAETLAGTVQEAKEAGLLPFAAQTSESWDAVDILRRRAFELPRRVREEVLALCEVYEEKLGERPGWATDD